MQEGYERAKVDTTLSPGWPLATRPPTHFLGAYRVRVDRGQGTFLTAPATTGVITADEETPHSSHAQGERGQSEFSCTPGLGVATKRQ